MLTAMGTNLSLSVVRFPSNLSLYGERSCNGVCVFDGGQVASVGEDGRIMIASAGTTKQLKTFEKADSCSLTAVTFIKHEEVGCRFID